jgi:tetratricopeptide (TPR) repeat protein
MARRLVLARFLVVAILFGRAEIGLSQAPGVDEAQRKWVHGLLEESLQIEVDAIGRAEKAIELRGVGSPFWQLEIRGRAGEHAQNQRLSEAISAQRARAKQASVEREMDWLIQAYAAPTNSVDGLARLIDGGKLDEVFPVLKTAAAPQAWKRIPGEDDPTFATRKHRWVSDRFWLMCKLAVAYHRAGNESRATECLNLSRKLLEGDRYSGKAFDADDRWLPEMDNVLFSKRKHRLTFDSTLVQTNRADLAIEWCLKGKDALMGRSRAGALVTLLAKQGAPERAIFVAERIYEKGIPLHVRAEISDAALRKGEIPLAEVQIREAMKELETLDEKGEYLDDAYLNMLSQLIRAKETTLANELLSKLMARIENFETAIVAGTLSPKLAGHGRQRPWAYVRLARVVVTMDTKAALQLMAIRDRVLEHKIGLDPAHAGFFPSWEIVPVVRAMSGEDSQEQDLLAVHGIYLRQMCEDLLQEGKLDLAKRHLATAARVIRDKMKGGLAHPNELFDQRQKFAVLAIQLGDFDSARELATNLPTDETSRIVHYAVVREIVKQQGVEKAKAWIEATTDAASKSGAILGLADGIYSEPQDLDGIPRAFDPNC